MPERDTADRQLARILQILPRASGRDGAAIADLAELLGVSEEQVLQDLQEVYARSYYLLASHAGDMGIDIDGDRVWVTGARPLDRPLRLNGREAVCLVLALRAAGRDASNLLPHLLAEFQVIKGRHEDASGPDAAERTEAEAQRFGISELDHDPAGIRETLIDAARDGRVCEIAYLKPTESEPEVRRVRPYTLLCHAGRWYLSAHCETNDGHRLFRVDRMLDARALEDTFDPAEGPDPEELLEEGRVFRASGQPLDVAVRYSPRIARWIVERETVTEAEDGSVTLTWTVSDPHWAVRHVLMYGEEAEVVEPGEIRGLVREVLEGMLEGS
jgi:proteasome accessory factor C